MPEGMQEAEQALERVTVESLKQTVRLAIEGLVEASEEDLAVFAERVSAQLALATMMPVEIRSRLFDQVMRQTRLLAEVQRVRVADAMWETIEATLWGVVAGVGTLLTGVSGSPILGAIARGLAQAATGTVRDE